MPPRRHQDDAQPSLEDWWQDPEVVDEHVRQARTTGVAAAGPVRLRTDPGPQPALFDISGYAALVNVPTRPAFAAVWPWARGSGHRRPKAAQ
jgi:hypothetical protein